MVASDSYGADAGITVEKLLDGIVEIVGGLLEADSHFDLLLLSSG
jgi:hypothetical protein